MEIVQSIDFVIFLVVGIVIGGVSPQLLKRTNLLVNIIVATAGSVISGFIFDWLDFMNFGDVADPVIAGALGAILLLLLTRPFLPKQKESV